MTITLQQFIVWLIVGALAGTLTGRLVTRHKGGFGLWKNLGIGLVGALIGGIIFEIFKIDFLSETTISARNVVAALLGSLIFIGALAFWRKRKQRAA
jgi:uncharacterized membrane protein YeaQ/YmgE (transglycosylase-associated protein family)